jgi:molybdopterin-guanine dinucleotide biosynthesis protein A
MKFSAVILAGGKSSRMGRDKAFLDLDGEPLLGRQIRVAREAGAAEVIVSGRRGVNYSGFQCPVVLDGVWDGGPVAGILAGLEAAVWPLVMVLAVDMPCMCPAMLGRLLSQCDASRGAVPRVGGRLEPLAAFHCKSASVLGRHVQIAGARSNLTAGSPAAMSATAFSELCRERGYARFVDFPASCDRFFVSWNAPGDLTADGRRPARDCIANVL